MHEVLLDSDILIDHLRGYDPARQYLQRFEAGEEQGYLSVISVAELATGQMRQEGEEDKVRQLLALFTPIALDVAIAWRGGKFGADITLAWRMLSSLQRPWFATCRCQPVIFSTLLRLRD